ncbi:hypothetical protein BD626DRAFT_241734 [Schizophyllum amplum]|uniref:Uncharacterized protein n=1 Tax=Schizophyllum amplum TaxID=97359 RepID=A0A550BW19_9AGAR|nr:hypothetical protein BD626DRAFT_241734 [Auriculariopsis ampla]
MRSICIGVERATWSTTDVVQDALDLVKTRSPSFKTYSTRTCHPSQDELYALKPTSAPSRRAHRGQPPSRRIPHALKINPTPSRCVRRRQAASIVFCRTGARRWSVFSRTRLPVPHLVLDGQYIPRDGLGDEYIDRRSASRPLQRSNMWSSDGDLAAPVPLTVSGDLARCCRPYVLALVS